MFNLQEYNKGNDVKAIGCMTWWTVFEKRASYDAVVDAIKGCMPNSTAVSIAARTRLRYPEINAAIYTLTFLAV